MKIPINLVGSAHNLHSYDDINTDYNNLVLHYIKDNRPAVPLNALIQELKNLTPARPPTIHSLACSLQYSNSALRDLPDFNDYLHENLNHYTSQLLGIRMLINDMLNKFNTQVEEDSQA